MTNCKECQSYKDCKPAMTKYSWREPNCKSFVKTKPKPEWKKLAPGVYWCRGCGCIKLSPIGGKHPRPMYLVPRRERERRKAKR